MVVDRVSRVLALADDLLGRIDVASTRTDGSSQAALAKAFRGELLPNGEG